MGSQRICELCSNEAVVYCPSDSAFLCLICDTKVHGANFLVARHLRQVFCSNCQDFTGDVISGVVFQEKALICPVCSPTELGSGELDSLSSSSTSCVSSSFCGTAKNKKRKLEAVGEVNGGQRVNMGIDSKTVGVFVNWCKRFGLNNNIAAVVIRMACDGLAVSGGKLTILPFRVCLVASLWFGLRFSRIRYLSGLQGLTRLEQITGVPGKIISATESKIEQVYRSAKQHQKKLMNQHDQLLKEGWDESS